VHIRNVTVRDVRLTGGPLPFSIFAGFDEEHAEGKSSSNDGKQPFYFWYGAYEPHRPYGSEIWREMGVLKVKKNAHFSKMNNNQHPCSAPSPSPQPLCCWPLRPLVPSNPRPRTTAPTSFGSSPRT
jgi:hypothetical protein